MDYWQRVVEEVLNKDDKNFLFVFTNLRERHERDGEHQKDSAKISRKKELEKVYYLGRGFANIYLTQREVDVAELLLEDLTFMQVADAVMISHRTVEYYVKNMKSKLGVRSKAALVELLVRAPLFGGIGRY